MEATAELLMKLQRRRDRMGERSPLRDMDNAASEPRTKDFDVVVKVQQRRSCFEGSENQTTPSGAVPGKLDLGRWQQPVQSDTETFGQGRKWRRPKMGEVAASENQPRLATRASEIREQPRPETCEMGQCTLTLASLSAAPQLSEVPQLPLPPLTTIPHAQPREPPQEETEAMGPGPGALALASHVSMQGMVHESSQKATLEFAEWPQTACPDSPQGANQGSPQTTTPESLKEEVERVSSQTATPDSAPGVLAAELEVRLEPHECLAESPAKPAAESPEPPQVFMAESPEQTLQAESPAESSQADSQQSIPASASSAVQPHMPRIEHMPRLSCTSTVSKSLEGLALGSKSPRVDFGRGRGWPGRHLGPGPQASLSQPASEASETSEHSQSSEPQELSKTSPRGWPGRHLGPGPQASLSQPSSETSAEVPPQALSAFEDMAIMEDCSQQQMLQPAARLQAEQGTPAGCFYRRLSEGGEATAASASTAACDAADNEPSSPCVEEDGDGVEPLEYFLLDYAGELPDDVVAKLKADIEIHEDFVKELGRRNEKLKVKAQRFKDSEASPAEGATGGECHKAAEGRRRELVVQSAQSSIAAAQEANKRVAAEAYEAAMHAKLTRTCRRAEAHIATLTRKAEKTEEETRKKKHVAVLERASTRCEMERVTNEVARTEAQVSDLEEAIRNEGQRSRDKEAERKAVSREVEALRCEARAHRARAGKHIRTEQRMEALTRELEATRAKTAALSK